MGRYITPTPSTSQNRPIRKQQVFTTTGIFTPSQKLLDAGGVVKVRCVGAGGGSSYNSGGGSSGMDITRTFIMQEAIYVYIGVGGHGPYGVGGSTSFGTLLTALGGNPGQSTTGGTSSGEGSQAGENPHALPPNSTKYLGRGGGGGLADGRPNTGGGGGGSNTAGGSGMCIVT